MAIQQALSMNKARHILAWSSSLNQGSLSVLQKMSEKHAPGAGLTVITAENMLGEGKADVEIIDLNQNDEVRKRVAQMQQQFIAEYVESGINDLYKNAPALFLWRGVEVFRKTFIKLLISVDAVKRAAVELLWIKMFLSVSQSSFSEIVVLSKYLEHRDLKNLGFENVFLTGSGNKLIFVARKFLLFGICLGKEVLAGIKNFGKCNLPKCDILYPSNAHYYAPHLKPVLVVGKNIVKSHTMCLLVRRGNLEAAKKICEDAKTAGVLGGSWEGSASISLVFWSCKFVISGLVAAVKNKHFFFMILPLIPMILTEVWREEQIIKKTGAKVVVHNSLGDPLAPMRSLVAKQQGARAVLVTGGWFDDTLAHTRHFDFAAVAAWGEYQKEMLQKMGVPKKNITVTGRIAAKNLQKLESLPEELWLISQSKRLIVFFCQGFKHPFYLNPLGITPEPLRALCLEVAKRNDVHLVLKPHPDDDPKMYHDFNKLADNISICAEPLFPAVLAEHAYLIGTYFSTAMLEVLNSGVPCFTLNFMGCRNFIPLAELGAAVEINNYEDMPNTLLRLLQDKKHRENLSKRAKECYDLIIGMPDAEERIADFIVNQVAMAKERYK